MITGDHQGTAKAIAKRVGILTHPTIEDIAAEYGMDPLVFMREHSEVKAKVGFYISKFLWLIGFNCFYY